MDVVVVLNPDGGATSTSSSTTNVVALYYLLVKLLCAAPHSEVTRPCARGDTSPGGVSGLPKSASPCALCSHFHRRYIACLASSPSPLAPLHLHIRLVGDPEVTLHYLTVPPHTLASLASPSTTIPLLATLASTAFSPVNQAPQNPTFQTPPWPNANRAGSI